MLNTWLNTGMAEPYVMASARWGTPSTPTCNASGVPQSLAAVGGRKSITHNWQAGSPAPNGGYRIYYDQAGKPVFRAGVSPTVITYKDNNLSRTTYCYVVTAWNDCNGNGIYDSSVDKESAASNRACTSAQ